MKNFVTFLLLFIIIMSVNVQLSKSYSRKVYAAPNDDGTITFHWDKINFDLFTSEYFLYYNKRDNLNQNIWQPVKFTSIDVNVFSWTDSASIAGTASEYWIQVKNQFIGSYIFAGNKFPGYTNMGRVILLIDSTYIVPLDLEINRLVQDLDSDGWQVIKEYAGRNEKVVDVKAKIKIIYDEHDGMIRSLFILGHVPVPYSGTFSGKPGYTRPFDGHVEGNGDHTGAWAADVFYGVFNGVWTDTASVTTGSEPRNRNYPGDGKYDQCRLPGEVKLEIGRVDLYNLPAYSKSDTLLMKDYLDRDHSYRTGELKAEDRALISDNFPQYSLAVTGYENAYRFCLPDSIASNVDYLTAQRDRSYLWSYGCGGGYYDHCTGIGAIGDFASTKLNNIFTALGGSFFGDWDSQNCILRAPLASGSLECFWGGIPEWFLHHMAMGMNIGYSAKITQNNKSFYFDDSYGGSNSVIIALMGDPTLKLKYIKPPTDFEVKNNSGVLDFTWVPSQDHVDGYNLYLVNDSTNDYKKINKKIIKCNSFSYDLKLNPGNYQFAVRACKLDTNGSGSYYVQSVSSFADIKIIDGVAEEIPNHENFNIYPSISKDFVDVNCDRTGEIFLMDISGKILLTDSFNQSYKINLQDYSSGTYFVLIKNSLGMIISGNFIKI